MIIEPVFRLLAGLFGGIQTRLELASVEFEEEARRFLLYLMLSLATLFFLGVTLLLLTFLVVILWWDSYRVMVLVGLVIFFGLVGLLLLSVLLRALKEKSRFLQATLHEINLDIEAVQRSINGNQADLS